MANPAPKKPAVENALSGLLGKSRANTIRENKCTRCEKDVSMEEFTTPMNRKEYTISGFCQSCQNDIFGPTEPETPDLRNLAEDL